ncbi:MAG: hypothetical protein ABIO05_08135 [Ferruginibacter sp.]
MKPIEIRDKVLTGGKIALERLLEKKKKDKAFIVISENGKVVQIMARDFKQIK